MTDYDYGYQERNIVNAAIARARGLVRAHRTTLGLPNRALTTYERSELLTTLKVAERRLFRAVEHVASVGSQKRPRGKKRAS